MTFNILHPSIHPSIHYLDRLSGAGSRWQLAKQGPPGFLLPSHALQFLLGDPEAFPGQTRLISLIVLLLPIGFTWHGVVFFLNTWLLLSWTWEMSRGSPCPVPFRLELYSCFQARAMPIPILCISTPPQPFGRLWFLVYLYFWTSLSMVVEVVEVVVVVVVNSTTEQCVAYAYIQMWFTTWLYTLLSQFIWKIARCMG